MAGAASTVINGNNTDRVLDLIAGTVSISGITVRNGNVNQGGGISNNGNLTLTDVVVTANTGNSGGGIWCSNISQLQLVRVVVSGNSSSNGGGLYANLGTVTITDTTFSGNSATNNGGGAYIKSTTTITGSTFSGNTAGGSGGGLFNQGSVSLTNDTISGNTATINGGGIYFQFGGSLMNVTIANNTATAGAGLYNNGNVVNLTNTIIAKNSGSRNCGGTLVPPVTSLGYNLEDANSCLLAAVGDIPNQNAELNPLASNGGPTQTIALKSNSKAIDKGTSVGAPPTDQRGVVRGPLYDIGAYEGGVVTRQPDLMIKLASEADTAYVIDNLYQAVVTNLQTKGQSTLNSTAASYAVMIQNDGSVSDSFVITGTAGTASFAVQYLDELSVDRTAAVIGAGYTVAALAADASVVWTLKVTPAVAVSGGTSFPVTVTATSSTDITKKDQIATVTFTPIITAQSKMTLNNVAAVYTLTIKNLGFAADNIILTGTGISAGFTVQYLDPGSVDRSAAVTGAGYTIISLAAGATVTWTVTVTPVIDLPGGSSYPVTANLTSQSSGTLMSQTLMTTSTPALTIIKQVWEPNGAAPLAAPTAAVGAPLIFLIYVQNSTAIPVVDVRINDLLDESAFDYVPGSLFRTSAASPPTDTATPLQIFTATASGTGTPLTDSLNGDVASALTTGGLPAVDRITIGAVTGQANAPLTVAPNSSFGLRYSVKMK